MQLVVFDASVWVSNAGYPGSVPYRAVDAARLGLVGSVASEAIIDQVRRALSSPRFAFPPELVDDTEEEIRRLSSIVDPVVRLAVIAAKESDNRILECAVAGEADVIVTGDRKHLLPLGAYEGIRIVSPADFLRSLGRALRD
jgi:putative PIN family toxin of toxin-antitoxin system